MTDIPEEIHINLDRDGELMRVWSKASISPTAIRFIRADVAEILTGKAVAKKNATIKELKAVLEKARSKLVEHEKYLDSKLAYDGVYKPSKTVCEIDAALAKHGDKT